MKLVMLILSAVLLSACSSTPTPINEAKNISKERVFAVQPLENEDKFATLKILRDVASDDVFLEIEIWVDGELNAILDSKELHIQKLNPKEYIIEARIKTTIGQISPAQVETIFREGRTYFYRLGYNHTGRAVRLLRDVKLSK